MKRVEQVAGALAVLACMLFLLTLPVLPSGPAVFAFGPTPPARARTAQVTTLAVTVLSLPVAAPEACLVYPEPAECAARELQGASVRAFWQQDDEYFPLGVALSDEHGLATLEQMPQGELWLLIEGPGHARRSLALTLSEPLQLKVALEPAHALQIRVVDEAQQPIDEATVLVSGGDLLPFGKLTSAQGVAAFNRLGRGPWQVSAAARGYEKVSQGDVAVDTTLTLRRLGGLIVTVSDPRGEPAPGAEVFIGGALRPPQRGITGDTGELQVRGLEQGAYDLRAVRGDQVSATITGFMLAHAATERVRLQLQPGRFVTVRVMDDEGEDAKPVAGADVVLVEYGIAPFPLQGRTDDEGEVRLGPISFGPASVSAHAEGFIGRAAVAVPDDLQGVLVIALRKGATLKGQVVDRNDHAIDGAEIEVIGTDLDGLPIAETPWFSAARRGHFETALAPASQLVAMGELGVMPGPIPGIPQTPLFAGQAPPLEPIEPLQMGSPWVSGVGGTFKLFPVTPGRVRLLVRHPQYVETLSDPVTLEPGGEANLKVVMLEGAALKGRVFDEGGFPVQGARLELVASRGVARFSGFTESDGSFEFLAVPQSIILSLARPSNPMEFVLRQNLELQNEEIREIELTLPAEREPVEVVISAEHQPVDLAQLLFVSLDAQIPLKKTLFSDPQGRAELADARGLALRLSIDAPGFAKYEETFDAVPERVEVELLRGVILEGTITAVRGRVAVAGATITLSGQGGRRIARSGALGQYEFADLNPGSVTLTVTHPEYATHQRKVTVKNTGRADRPFEVDPIDLQEGGSIRGVVLDAEGNPKSGAKVAVGVVPASLPAGELPPGIARSNERGEFELSNLEPGSITLQAAAVGAGAGKTRVEVRSGEVSEDVRIVLGEASSEEETGQSGGVAITLSQPRAGETRITQVAAHSEAERAGLQVGDGVLSIEGLPVESLSDAQQRLAGTPGTDVLIEIQRAGSIFKLRVTREALRH